MLDKLILKEDLIAVTKYKEYPGVWNDVAWSIKNHIEQYGQVEASYMGLIPGTPPVPSAFNAMPHYFRIITNISGPNLAIAGQIGLSSLFAGLSVELSKSTVSSCTTTNFTMPPTGPLIPITISFNTFPDDQHENVMDSFANAVVNAFLLTLPMPPAIATPAPVTAIDGSIGLLTFISIK